jgi:hypothetical protein
MKSAFTPGTTTAGRPTSTPWMPAPSGRSCDGAYDRLGDITGKPPACSAVPAWKCTPTVLEEKSRLPFAYNSDCRGQGLFYPVVDGRTLTQPQVPVTLPTYDEAIGQPRHHGE